MLNKKIQKTLERSFFQPKSNFGKLYRKNRLINIAPEHYFDIILADFEKIINNDFMQLEDE